MAGTATAPRLPRQAAFRPRLGSALLSRGIVVTWLSVIVLIPIVALTLKAFSTGPIEFWDAVSSPQAVEAFRTTVLLSLIVTAINCVMGTAIAWVLVRDEFPGKGLLNATIDLPFALPTIVAGLTLIALYGNDSPFGIDIVRTPVAVVMALLFVTLPFVVRSVQPTLIELDKDMEEAAASLGAGLQARRKASTLGMSQGCPKPVSQPADSTTTALAPRTSRPVWTNIARFKADLTAETATLAHHRKRGILPRTSALSTPPGRSRHPRERAHCTRRRHSAASIEAP